jgi:oligopeptide/dipeptide ABC transporter ATP-binding protein
VDRSIENLLRIQGLGVTYSQPNGESLRALDEISLQLRPGEVLGILGESGCGKSTLAHAIIGLLPRHAKTDSGEILFHDRDLLRLSETDLRQIRGCGISMIPQEPELSLNPVMPVGAQIAEVLRAHLPLTSKERRQRVTDLLWEVGFDQPARICNVYPHQLSGGQRQRIVIAQAIACQPAVLIADEPTSKLDGPLRSEIADLLSGLRQKRATAILVISHDLALMTELADRVAVMYSGRIVELGTRREMFLRPFHPYTHALLQLAQSSLITVPGAKQRFPQIEGEPANVVALQAGCRFEPRCPERMSMCVTHSPREVAPEPSRSVSCFKYGE